MKYVDFTYFTYFLIFRRLMRVGNVYLGQSQIPFFRYGVIQFGRETGLGPCGSPEKFLNWMSLEK